MKIDRLIGILSVLLQKEKVTSRELAEKFEVSQRTILRDVDTLCRAGIPLLSEQGSGGGISIMDGYTIDRTLLSSEDIQAILAGLKSLDSVSNSNKYRLLMDRLSSGQPRTAKVNNSFIIDLSSWDKSAVSDKIELIKKALEQRHIISFRYFSPNGESCRRIEPYHLIFQWSSWYVWGYCTDREDYRMFKLTRMAELAVTEDMIPERNVPGYTCDKLRHTKGEIKVTVRFDNSVRWRIIDEFGTDIPKDNGSNDLLMSFTWSDKQSFFSYILTFGSSAEIIEPPEYRKEFGSLLKNIFSKYET